MRFESLHHAAFFLFALKVLCSTIRNQVEAHLNVHGVEVWMSGLVCMQTAQCSREFTMLIGDTVGAVSSSTLPSMGATSSIASAAASSRTVGGVPLIPAFAKKGCPPGCDCDNL